MCAELREGQDTRRNAVCKQPRIQYRLELKIAFQRRNLGFEISSEFCSNCQRLSSYWMNELNISWPIPRSHQNSPNFSLKAKFGTDHQAVNMKFICMLLSLIYMSSARCFERRQTIDNSELMAFLLSVLLDSRGFVQTSGISAYMNKLSGVVEARGSSNAT